MIVHCDGAARGNPGPAGIGVHIADEEGRTVHEIGIGIGVATNNVAEYSALIAGLEWCAENGVREVAVLADSDLMVKQMTGVYRVKNAGLKPLHARARKLASGFRRISFEHVRREFNREADRLANIGVDAWLSGDPRTDGQEPSLF